MPGALLFTIVSVLAMEAVCAIRLPLTTVVRVTPGRPVMPARRLMRALRVTPEVAAVAAEAVAVAEEIDLAGGLP